MPGAAGAWGDGEVEGCGYVGWCEIAEFLVQSCWGVKRGGGGGGEVSWGWGDGVVGGGGHGGSFEETCES